MHIYNPELLLNLDEYTISIILNMEKNSRMEYIKSQNVVSFFLSKRTNVTCIFREKMNINICSFTCIRDKAGLFTSIVSTNPTADLWCSCCFVHFINKEASCREIKWLFHSHTTEKWQKQDSHSYSGLRALCTTTQPIRQIIYLASIHVTVTWLFSEILIYDTFLILKETRRKKVFTPP